MQPFLLQNRHEYRQWREAKLRDYPVDSEQLVVEIRNPFKLTTQERDALLAICQKTNLAIYRCLSKNVTDSNIVSALAAQVGLQQMDANLCADEDKISAIQVVDKGRSSTYIPYTNKPLNWHTDGYYNQDQERIRAFLMYCVRPASSGGINAYLDPEILYILLRDENPDYIEALMDKNAMMIPANLQDHEQIRGEKTGPVFLIDENTQTLYMRYSARTRNVVWNDNTVTQHARNRMLEILNDNHYVFRHRLQAGEGVLCNNVLHNRTLFVDDPTAKRLLYRARFYERVSKSKHSDNDMETVSQCCG